MMFGDFMDEEVENKLSVIRKALAANLFETAEVSAIVFGNKRENQDYIDMKRRQAVRKCHTSSKTTTGAII